MNICIFYTPISVNMLGKYYSIICVDAYKTLRFSCLKLNLYLEQSVRPSHNYCFSIHILTRSKHFFLLPSFLYQIPFNNRIQDRINRFHDIFN